MLKYRGLDWIGLRLSVVSNRYTHPLYGEIAHSHGLSRDEAAVVVCLSYDTGPSAQNIVKYTGRPKNTISRAVRNLEAKRMLRREDDTLDARASRLFLSERGHSLFARIKGSFVERDRRMLGALKEEEQREFDRLLRKISEASESWM